MPVPSPRPTHCGGGGGGNTRGRKEEESERVGLVVIEATARGGPIHPFLSSGRSLIYTPLLIHGSLFPVSPMIMIFPLSSYSVGMIG